MARKGIEFVVGLFMLAGLCALVVLAFKVSGLTKLSHSDTYQVTAEFDNIGGLKIRAPVAIGGVRIGEVTEIGIDKNDFRAVVTMRIDDKFNILPIDTAASIFTQGILGSNYVSLTPGFETDNLKNGDQIETTHSALVLENLIGQLIYSMKSDKNEADDDSSAKKEKTHAKSTT